MKNNLKIAHPTGKTWMFKFNEQFNATKVNGYPEDVPFDMFLFHSIWNYTEVRKVVPDGPAVTVLRDPVELFESGYVYFNNKPKVMTIDGHLNCQYKIGLLDRKVRKLKRKLDL